MIHYVKKSEIIVCIKELNCKFRIVSWMFSNINKIIRSCIVKYLNILLFITLSHFIIIIIKHICVYENLYIF